MTTQKSTAKETKADSTVEERGSAGSGSPASLERYRRRRDFQRTAEPPPGRTKRARGPLSFVIQKHAASRLHYDFRLEVGGVLKSWAVPKGPSLDPHERRLAVMVEDHPLAYAGFEGSIPEGEYGGGQAIVWDRGTYAPEREDGEPANDRAEAERTAQRALAQGHLSFVLHGEKLSGSWTLLKMGRGANNWLLVKRHDAAAAEGRDVLQEDRSVLSGRAIEDVASGHHHGRRSHKAAS